MRGRSTPQARARPCHCQSRGLTSISLKRPSRGSSRNSVCAMPRKPSAASSASACSTTSSRQRASPTRQVPKPRGICTSLRPQNRPSAVSGGIRVRADRPERGVVAGDDLLQQRLAVGGAAPGLDQLRGRLAHEHGPAEAALERDRVAGLDDRRIGQLRPRRARLVLVVGGERERHADAGGLRDGVLMALPLQRLEHVPAAPGQLVGGRAARRCARPPRAARRGSGRPPPAPRTGARRARRGSAT